MRLMKLALAGVALAALVFAIACGSSSNTPVAPTPPPAGGGGGGSSSATITIANFAFSPSSMTIKAGQSVAWHNSDTTTHTATSDSGAFDTGSIPPGSTSSAVTMSTPGTFTYHCSIHPFMTASLTVTQ